MPKLDDWNEIRIFDDHLDDLEIMRTIINQDKVEEAFHLLDIGDIVRKYRSWTKRLPRIVPHYAVKCNPNPVVVKTMAALGASFDCASMQEIQLVLNFGVSPERIIFANPVKTPNQIRYSRKVGVEKMTADNLWELDKIKNLYPDAKIVIRIRCDASITKVHLGCKFGCDPGKEALQMIYRCRELNLNLHGFSFHVGSLCGEALAVGRGIETCKCLIEAANRLGFKSTKMIDIGGGFPGGNDSLLDEFVEVIKNALQNVDESIQVISEPGRYFVSSAGNAAVNIYGKKSINDNGITKMMYYLNDGVCGSFFAHFLGVETKLPKLLYQKKRFATIEKKKYPSILWGQTTEAFDYIAKDVYLPEYNIGDWLYWSDMGSYTGCFKKDFNSFAIPTTIPIMRKSCLKSFTDGLCEKKNQSLKSQTDNKDIYLKIEGSFNNIKVTINFKL